MSEKELVAQAVLGDQAALEELLAGVQDRIYNLSLRMLGAPQDAEDAAQDINVKIITHLSTFRGESGFSTWVYRIAVNTLLNYRKGRFSHASLTFEIYGEDIRSGGLEDCDAPLLAEELKLSCTNVMLQCLDARSRCIFILGTMFRLDSAVAGEILEMTPENYRQQLSRARKKVAGFLGGYCGLAGGPCDCGRRVNHALRQGRIHPDRMEFSQLEKLDADTLRAGKETMEWLDEASQVFGSLPAYRSPVAARDFMTGLLQSARERGGIL